MLVLNFMLSLMTSFEQFLVWVTVTFVINCLKVIGISMLRMELICSPPPLDEVWLSEPEH